MATVQEIEIVSSVVEPAATIPPTQGQIAALAYTLWQQRGCPEGSPDEDWFAAESQIVQLIADREK